MTDSHHVALPISGNGSDVTSDVDNVRLEREKKLKKACADFESLFIYQMLKAMRATVPKSGLLNTMTGKDTYEMMMDQKVAEELANKGGIGLQNPLFNQLKKGNSILPSK